MAGRRRWGPALQYFDDSQKSVMSRLLAAIETITAQAPFRRMVTPGGFEMSVAMTNYGAARLGHRPLGLSLPGARPAKRRAVARDAASNFSRSPTKPRPRPASRDFVPDACLINRYEPGAKLSLHQDKDEAGHAPSHRVGLARPARHLPVRRPEAHRSGTTRGAGARRRRGLGRPVTPLPSRRPHLEKRRASADRSRRFNLTLRKAL